MRSAVLDSTCWRNPLSGALHAKSTKSKKGASLGLLGEASYELV